ncbi:hypothetical protein PMI16_00198 [Herbaspirillum sp. CF444]|nr:hypothetical protein [Herbaspirillum sp. CF444]EJL94427.1 hypothetical protein PMI16_00198 [Herbaspirillum sp. CF444]
MDRLPYRADSHRPRSFLATGRVAIAVRNSARLVQDAVGVLYTLRA